MRRSRRCPTRFCVVRHTRLSGRPDGASTSGEHRGGRHGRERHNPRRADTRARGRRATSRGAARPVRDRGRRPPRRGRLGRRARAGHRDRRSPVPGGDLARGPRGGGTRLPPAATGSPGRRHRRAGRAGAGRGRARDRGRPRRRSARGGLDRVPAASARRSASADWPSHCSGARAKEGGTAISAAPQLRSGSWSARTSS